MEISNLTKNRITDYIALKKRFDNREMLEHREIFIETGISKNAEGSARVKIGETEVIAGVKMDAAEPFSDSPEDGVLVTTVEHTPLSSPRFESGPPQIGAIEMARIVDRGIRESGFIDLKKLCIKKEEKVWFIYLDMYSINDAGNLTDACALAAIAALKTARFPEYDEKKEKVVFGSFTDEMLPLTESIPITLTFYKINNAFILDPVSEEEEASTCKLSISLSKKGKKILINSCQKSGEEVLSKDELFSLLDKSIEKWKQLEPKILRLIEKK